MYPQGVCRIRKPACAGNGCAIFPAFETAQLGKKIRCSAEDDLFRGSLGQHRAIRPDCAVLPCPSARMCARRGGKTRKGGGKVMELVRGSSGRTKNEAK